MFKNACFLLALSATATAADASHMYIVRLQDAPLVEHARERADRTGLTRGLGEKAAVRRQLQSSESADYLRRLDVARAQVLGAGSAALGRVLQPRHVFRHAANGLALTLTEAEAEAFARLPGVAAVRRERRQRLLTDVGPQWIGADKLWNGQVSGAKTKGEGVVIGIVDTGINPTHPSFAAQGADGYAIGNPRGHFYGLCTSGQAACNNKLIGIYDFTDEGTNGVDSVGHGSHVAGIAAGDPITESLQGHTAALQRQVSGVAPHANIIMYKACTLKDGDGSCAESDIVAALDQATADGVDVINYSIGGDAVDPYALLDSGGNDAASMFQARAAGIVVVVAAGNEGPGPHSIDEPGNVPWVISVANASHNRRFANSLGDFSGVADPPPILNGQGYTAGYGPADIVYAGSFGNALCGIGDSEGTSPTGASNPFAPGTFHGEIVLCDRGTYARVEKGYNVLHAGAGGFVLANTADDGESTVSDDHFLPAVHLGFSEGEQLKRWLASAGAHGGRIAGVSAAVDDSFGDILQASSSRGPTGFGVLKPDLTAPGTNILSAAKSGSGAALMTGTSMASPHVAGAAALVIAAHPDWSPAQVESALIGTALAASVRKEDALTPGTPREAGAGRVQPANAVGAGLYLPLSNAEISAQDPARGGKPENLNRAGIESESCFGQCSFSRTVADMSGGGSWQASVTATANAHVTITPSQFTLASGAAQTLHISIDVSDPHLPGTWVDGRIVLHKSTGGQNAADFALPLTVYASPGAAQPFRELTTNKPFFDTTLNLSGLVALPRAQFTPTWLSQAVVTDMSLGVDSKPNELYSTFPGTGKQFVTFPILPPSGFSTHVPSPQGRVFIVEIAASTATSTTLYAGIDSNGNGQPDYAEQACVAHGVGARCIVDLRGASAQLQVWALVDIPSGTAGATYSVSLSSGLPMSWASALNDSHDGVTGPGHVPASANIPVRMATNSRLYRLSPGRYYGALLIDAQPVSDMAGHVGFVPFALTRTPGSNDVVDPLTFGESGRRIDPIAAGESLRHVFVDIPDTRMLDFDTYTPPDGSSLSFYVVRSDSPPAAQAADIAAAPPPDSAVAQWSIGGASNEQLKSLTLGRGRWYLVATNTDTNDGYLELVVYDRTGNGGTAVPPPPGAFFNPERSGHGIFISQAAGQQVVYWYTYLEDGTPTWYAAQGPAPAAGSASWSAPLFSVNWDGAQVNSYSVLGEMILTPLDADDLVFSWHLYGDAGSERFTRIGPTAPCVNLGSAQANLDGQWFAPAQSGYGMDVFSLSAAQQDTFYLYDALGKPIWIAGSASAVAGVNTLAMYQLSGFCPLCSWVAPQTTPVGSLTANFSSGTQGHYATQINLAPPLAGTWNIDQPMARLTGSATCSP